MDKTLITQLIDVATGRIPHIYQGTCPDVIEGHQVRDEECPACRIVIEAERANAR